MTKDRHWYAYGYRSRDAAEDALEDCFAAGEVSACEAPEVRSYRARSGERRWGISVRAA